VHYRLPYPLAWHYVLRPDDVRRVEIGYRTAKLAAGEEPPAYEWNVQHTKGRYARQKDEAEMWVGDENLVDVNFVIHYRLSDPVAAMFQLGPQLSSGGDKWETVVRAAAESAFRVEMARRPADDLLESKRQEVADAVLKRARRMLESYNVGLELLDVCLRDVHPPEDVVGAFREVSSAMEEKEAQINEAEAYQYQTEALARGQAAGQIAQAEGLATDRTERAVAGAARFVAIAAAYARSPEVTRLRWYLQTVETALAGRRKVILDAAAQGTRRMLYLGRKGLGAPAAAAPLVAEPAVASPDLKGTPTP
jgi:membrane protease subunit HflK